MKMKLNPEYCDDIKENESNKIKPIKISENIFFSTAIKVWSKNTSIVLSMFYQFALSNFSIVS